MLADAVLDKIKLLNFSWASRFRTGGLVDDWVGKWAAVIPRGHEYIAESFEATVNMSVNSNPCPNKHILYYGARMVLDRKQAKKAMETKRKYLPLELLKPINIDIQYA